ncbi:unnamed protein product [Somion occarium]|uniref:Uncharacterized protein n=1 Tax=Somion occarium TaxID=3059160 RepID=A0ABP1CSN8_9APHY
MAAKCDTVDTIRIDENDLAPLAAPLTLVLPSMSPSSMPTITVNSKMPSTPLPSLLLCPRRTFLACLILASKFMQDRAYSNRAWVKLAGLPSREIDHCNELAVKHSNGIFGLANSLPMRLHLVSDPAVMPVLLPSVSSISKVSGLRQHATVRTLGSNSAPVQDRFVQHSMFLNSRPVEEPERMPAATCQVESPSAMFVSPPTIRIFALAVDTRTVLFPHVDCLYVFIRKNSSSSICIGTYVSKFNSRCECCTPRRMPFNDEKY